MAHVKKNQGSVETPKNGKVPVVFNPISVFFEKKVRNLEKRKAKLDSYRELQKAGKLTDSGQISAVAKYEEVSSALLFASNIMQELLPVLMEISSGLEKAALDKEKEREKQVKATLRSLLDIQDIYEQLGDDTVRNHFASGKENTVHLSEKQLAAIDKLYLSSKPSRSDSDGTFKAKADYKKCLDESVSSWYRLLHKTGSIEGTEVKTEEARSMFESINSCGYFDVSNNPVEVIETTQSEHPVESNAEVIEVEPPKPATPIEPYENAKPMTTDILGSLQGRVVNFVQDDYEHVSSATPPVVNASIIAGSNDAGVTYNGGYQDNYNTGLQGSMSNMNINDNRQPMGHFNGNSFANEESNNSIVSSDVPSTNMNFSTGRPQGTFPVAESWADETPEPSYENLTSGGDTFVEVKKGGGQTQRYGGQRNNNDFGGRGGGGYRGDYQRGGMNRGGNRGFDSRGGGGGFNRPYRTDYNRDDSNQGGQGQGGGGMRYDNYFPRGARGGYGGKEFSSRSGGGQGNRGGNNNNKPMRGGFERPQTFTTANAAAK